MGRGRGGAGRGARGGAGGAIDEEARYGPPGVVAGMRRPMTPADLNLRGRVGMDMVLEDAYLNAGLPFPRSGFVADSGRFNLEFGTRTPDVAATQARQALNGVFGRGNVTVTRSVGTGTSYTVSGNVRLTPASARRFTTVGANAMRRGQ